MIHQRVSYAPPLNTKKMKKKINCHEQIGYDDLPQEIMTNIFLRLPVKSILRCKCVCKSWNRLTNDPCFIKLHLIDQSVQVSVMFNIVSCEYPMSCVEPDDGDSAIVLESTATAIDFKDSKFRGHRIVGSCNGLLLIVNMSYLTNGHNNKTTWLQYLWNPSTRECIELPTMCIDISGQKITLCIDMDGWSCTRSFGFGYDPKDDDYKVVHIFSFSYSYLCFKKRIRGFGVYSLRSNTWKKITLHDNEFPYSIHECNGKYVNGAVYWTGVCRNPKGPPNTMGIVCFDFRSEEWTEVPLPNQLFYNRDNLEYAYDLAVSRGHLYVVDINNPVRQQRRESKVDIYVLKEEHRQWCKLYCISWSVLEKNMMLFCSLVCFTKDDKIMLQVNNYKRGGLIIYDPKHQNFNKIKIDGIPISSRHLRQGYKGLEYVRSLVPLKPKKCFG